MLTPSELDHTFRLPNYRANGVRTATIGEVTDRVVLCSVACYATAIGQIKIGKVA